METQPNKIIELGKSKLISHKQLLLDVGYKTGPHYIGMLNNMFLYCINHRGYYSHELLVKDSNNWRYVCSKCNCNVEWVG